jgi:hypothetical protein
MKLASYLLLFTALVTSAKASTVVLTFEGLGDEETVNNYYNGGLGGSGSGPGPNYGITFESNALAIISNQDGGSGNFAGNPSGDTIVFFLTGTGDVMNVAGGFTTGFSFFYSAINNPGTVTVYSGLDATGTVLATLNLPTTPSNAGNAVCQSDQFCPFSPFGVTFAGTAMSVDFSGVANQIGFDNITLGSSTPGGMSPEPATYALMGGGLVAAGLFRSRRRR